MCVCVCVCVWLCVCVCVLVQCHPYNCSKCAILVHFVHEDKHAAGDNVANKTHILSNSSGTKYRASERAYYAMACGARRRTGCDFRQDSKDCVVRRGGVCKTIKEIIELVCFIP